MSDIIIVTPDIVGPIKNGGIGTACYHYARTLANSGYSVDILFTGVVAEPELTRWKAIYAGLRIGFWTLADLAKEELLVYGVRWYTARSWAVMQFLRSRSDRYVIFQDWHANGFWPARAKRMGFALQHAKLGLIVHSPTEWQHAGMQTFGPSPIEDADLAWAERQAIAEVDCLISPSQHMIDWLREHRYKLPDEIVLCPITFEDAPAHRKMPAPDLEHLVFFGRLETRKGLHLLAGALRSMHAKDLPKKLSLLGKYATVEGIPSESYIAGLKRDLPSIDIEVETTFDYSQAVDYIRRHNGLVVMPSTLDNFPLTVVESIENGFHFLASNVGGIPEIANKDLLFQPTCTALRTLLAKRRSINFENVSHPYSSQAARTRWISHVESKLNQPPLPQAIRRSARGISVCIPFYKHDRYLKRLLTSFLRMRRSDLQLVIVNDGTPEADCPLFHEFAAKLTPLGHVFYTQENQGPGGARNKAVSLARYERILFFDADNVAFPNMISDLENAYETSKVDILSAPFIAVPPMTREPVMSDGLFIYRPSGGSLAASLFDNCFGDMCCMTHRKVLEKVGGLHTGRFYIEDWEMYIQAHGQGLSQWVYPEPVFFYTHEEHERRVDTPHYTNFTQLWSRLEAFDKNVLVDLTRSMAKEVYVKVQLRR